MFLPLLLAIIYTTSSFGQTRSHNSNLLSKIKELKSFSFGSCNRENLEQPLWNIMRAKAPELFIWGGDVIYGDKEPNQNNLELKYSIQNNIRDYVFLKENTAIVGIWDDHDYGTNNGDSSYPGKYKSQQLFLDFMEVETDSPLRSREGIYNSYTFGPKERRVKLILLDARFHRTQDSILGEQQWAWLENELKSSDAKIHFIMSPMPVLPGKMIHTEEWADSPKQKRKLFDLLRKYKTPGVVFLTGDKHFAAITEKDGFVEIMSSGLTHTTNRIFIPYLKVVFPISYFKRNFGLVNIDWENGSPILNVSIEGIEKTAIFRKLKTAANQFYITK